MACRRVSSAGFLDLVEQYSRFVAQLDGYAFTIYDYDNDVDARNLLDKALATVTSDERDAAEGILSGLDAAFLALTEPMQRRRIQAATKWNERIPIRRGEELASDIASGNL